ncbi:M48 family metallopeptidase [Paraglaciecola sp.]|uniref:M48 family metallopeptidase n=1 Tax=Paraglaciecola sp. TaxID=1920173 RepID=UPI003EF8EBBD
MLNKKVVIIALSTIALLTSCAKSPLGRNQLKLYSSTQLAGMGEQAFDSMKSEQKVSTKGVSNRYVQCVADAITKHVPKSVFNGNWELVVFDEPQVNAFALPGGKIGVYAGLLNVAENQAQLAAVIGHEVGHVIAEHGNERMSSNTLIGVGMQATNQLLKSKQVASSNMIMAGLGLGVQVGFQLPFGRTHETEADLIGLELMAKAGFQPQQSTQLWQNMDKAAGGKRQPEWLSTHPLPTSRIKRLNDNMASANTIYKSASDRPNCKK